MRDFLGSHNFTWPCFCAFAKTIAHAPLSAIKDRKMWTCRIFGVCSCTAVWLRLRRVRWGGAPLLPVLRTSVGEGCKRYPCLFSTHFPLTLLHPGKRGVVPWELDRTGRGQHAGQAFSHHEKKRNQIQAKSLSIYCIPHLSRAANWNQIYRGNCTMGEGSTRGEMKLTWSKKKSKRKSKGFLMFI